MGAMANLMLEGSPVMDKHPIQGGVEMLLIGQCYGNWNRLRQLGLQCIWPDTDLTFWC